jgi:predicted P-loop ATPase
VVNYLGVETSAYAQAVGRRFLIAAVARIYRPGCKADCALILEGEQGTWKSTALKTLTEPWFTDEIADFGSKDAAEQTVGVWLVELAELGSLSRPEVGKIKAFMSRSTDRFRPAYGRRVTEFPRQCVFAGTVNDDDYLRDETGGRRFWPIKCGTIEIAKLANSRDQRWAEATEAYRRGEPWWLDTDQLKRAASEQQAARYQGDPWDCEIRQYIEPTNEAGEPITEETKESVSVGEILTKVLQIEKGRWSQQDQNRVARCLKSMGWVRYQERDGAKRSWRYREKPVTSSD